MNQQRKVVQSGERLKGQRQSQRRRQGGTQRRINENEPDLQQNRAGKLLSGLVAVLFVDRRKTKTKTTYNILFSIFKNILVVY
jgi:hypothetical protein